MGKIIRRIIEQLNSFQNKIFFNMQQDYQKKKKKKKKNKKKERKQN
jgi:hypothetical protein